MNEVFFRFPDPTRSAGFGRPFFGTKRTPEGQWVFRFLWHPEVCDGLGLWHTDIYTTSQELLTAGLPIVCSPDLLEPYRARTPRLPKGALVGRSKINPPQDPRRYDLGVLFDLVLVYA